MTGFPFGLGARRTVGIVMALTPSSTWNGTAGSGFATTPSDPTRTTAKPAMRMLTPDFQAFTDELLVGVMAGANNGGSLYANLGLEKVVFHYEGTTLDVTAPSIKTFNDANGNSVSYLGWWAKLKHNATNGGALLYVEAVPKDATMQNRVMGPYRFNPSAALHDVELEIAPTPAEVTGERYKTLRAAFEWLRAQSFQQPRLTITEAGDHLISRPTSGDPANTGWITVEADNAVTLKDGDGDAGGFWLNVNQWRFKGSNITIDFEPNRIFRRQTSTSIPNRDYWFDGVNFTVSSGRYSLVDGTTKQPTINGANWFTECSFENGCNGGLAQLVRGGTTTRHWNDIANNSSYIVGHRISNADSSDYTAALDALTVSYSGSESSATIAISGGNNTNSRVVTLKYGASTSTLSIDNSSTSSGSYTVQDVADWINTITGFTATVPDNTRRAATLTITGADSFGAFGDTDVRTSALTLITAFDVHSDFYQMLNSIPADNIILWGNSGFDIEDMQMFLFQPTGVGARDVLVANNAFETASGTPFATQFQQSLSHIVFVHNVIAEQGILLRQDLSLSLDSYSLIGANVAEALDWSGTPFATSAIKDNHLYAGATAPANATGTTIGGGTSSLFASATTGDFAPAGDLLTNQKTALVAFDLNNAARPTSAPAGAVV
jgi:hypothetical protein